MWILCGDGIWILCGGEIWIPGTGIQLSPGLPRKARSTCRSSSFLLLCWDWGTLRCAVFPFHLLAFALEEGKKKKHFYLCICQMPTAVASAEGVTTRKGSTALSPRRSAL